MVVNRKPSGTASSMPLGLAMGVGLSLAITVGCSLLFGKLIQMGTLPENSLGYCAMAILFLSAVGGTVLANAKIKHRQLLVSGLCAGIYYVCLLAMTALFFGGQYQGMGVTALMVLAGAGVPLLLKGQGRGGKRRKRVKTPSR